MDSKNIYKLISETESFPLLGRYHWWNAVSVGKQWDVLLCLRNHSEQLVISDVMAAMPIHLFRKWGWKLILMPQHTQQTYLYMSPDEDAEVSSQAMAELLEKYCRENRIAYCQLQGIWNESFRTAVAQLGFTVSPCVSYQIRDVRTKDELIARYSKNKQRQLKRAVGFRCVSLNQDEFYIFHRACLKERGLVIDYSPAFAKALLSTTMQHNEAVIWGAMDENNELQAAVVLVYDEQSCYYLLPTYRTKNKKSGAMAWLTTEAIMWAIESNRVFDFEGSMTPSIARSYREFGGVPTTYYQIEKYYNPLIKWVIGWKRILRNYL